jgi:hypothetical protein
VTQPVAATNSSADNIGPRIPAKPRQTKALEKPMQDYPMFWVLLEIALGLGLFVFIVWWTLPRKEDRKSNDEP